MAAGVCLASHRRHSPSAGTRAMPLDCVSCHGPCIMARQHLDFKRRPGERLVVLEPVNQTPWNHDLHGHRRGRLQVLRLGSVGFASGDVVLLERSIHQRQSAASTEEAPWFRNSLETGIRGLKSDQSPTATTVFQANRTRSDPAISLRSPDRRRLASPAEREESSDPRSPGQHPKSDSPRGSTRHVGRCRIRGWISSDFQKLAGLMQAAEPETTRCFERT